MKLIHLSDLHFGKRVNEYSMYEDQQYIVEHILSIVKNEKPDGVIIAGDVYDKSVPSAEAVTLLDSFLTGLSELCEDVFVISGNHDSPERLAFGSNLMERCGVHISKVYDGNAVSYSLSDSFGKVNVYLLPFIKPAIVRKALDREDIVSYTDAVKAAIDNMPINTSERNVLVTHQFVTGSKRSESEEISVGGSDNVDASVFDDFDYVALGHIHSPQNCGSEKIRYCGTPLKYSFSEAGDNKSVTIVELFEKGELSVRTQPLVPLRDMVKIKGKYNDIMLRSFYENTSYPTDYVHITLTDEKDIIDAVGKLRTVYTNLMKLEYDNTRTRSVQHIEGTEKSETEHPIDVFSRLYELQNNQPLTDEQTAYLKKLISDIWEGEK